MGAYATCCRKIIYLIVLAGAVFSCIALVSCDFVKIDAAALEEALAAKTRVLGVLSAKRVVVRSLQMNDEMSSMDEAEGIDTDGDGIIDAIDTDGDGVVDDFDMDGIADDTDGDGIIDVLDPDFDGDGVFEYEGAGLLRVDGGSGAPSMLSGTCTRYERPRDRSEEAARAGAAAAPIIGLLAVAAIMVKACKPGCYCSRVVVSALLLSCVISQGVSFAFLNSEQFCAGDFWKEIIEHDPCKLGKGGWASLIAMGLYFASFVGYCCLPKDHVDSSFGKGTDDLEMQEDDEDGDPLSPDGKKKSWTMT